MVSSSSSSPHHILKLTYILLFTSLLLPPTHSKELKYFSKKTTSNFENLHPECAQWAAEGECQKDPTFMLKECAESCSKEVRKVEVQLVKEGEPSFFELSAKDWRGRRMEFERFEGYVTLVMNIGKVCGHAEEFYAVLEHIHNIWPWTIEILVFPFDAPPPPQPPSNSNEEGQTPIPPDCTTEYQSEAKRLESKLHIMEDATLNGPNTHPVYKYLKEKFSLEELEINFACTFLISPDGDVIEYHHRQSLDGLKEYVAGHLEADL